MRNMLFSELVEAVSGSRMAGQLLSLKRCFGPGAELGIAVGGGVDRCRTVAELIARGHAPAGLEWVDPFLAAVPAVSELPADEFAVVPSRYADGGPDCPWDVAGREREAARARALARRRTA